MSRLQAPSAPGLAELTESQHNARIHGSGIAIPTAPKALKRGVPPPGKMLAVPTTEETPSAPRNMAVLMLLPQPFNPRRNGFLLQTEQSSTPPNRRTQLPQVALYLQFEPKASQVLPRCVSSLLSVVALLSEAPIRTQLQQHLREEPAATRQLLIPCKVPACNQHDYTGDRLAHLSNFPLYGTYR